MVATHLHLGPCLRSPSSPAYTSGAKVMPDSRAPEVPRESGGNWTAWARDAWAHLSCVPLACGLKHSLWGVEFNIPRPHMVTLTWVSNPIVA